MFHNSQETTQKQLFLAISEQLR